MNNQFYREKNREHVQEEPPACMRKYGYMYNIAFVLLFSFYHFHVLLCCCLTHCSQETRKRVTGKPRVANSADPDQTLQNAASDQGLHCLQIVKSFFSRNM